MTSLRYPKDLEGAADYIQFTPREYRANNQTIANQRGGAFNDAFGGGAPAQDGARDVILYMPNSTPQSSESQGYGDIAFAGPFGDLVKLFGAGAVNTIDDQRNLSLNSTISNITTQFEQLKGGGAGLGGPALRQGGIQAVNQLVTGQDGAQLLAMSRGKVFNPNVELLYTNPTLRTFNFTFKFVPKSREESLIVNQIIFNFKKWSSPKALSSGMLEVPHVWEIKYMTAGRANKNMNQFKRAACSNVSVVANPQTSMHVAHDDGMPIEVVLGLNFKEVDIVTRQDHDAVQGQGF